LKIYLSPSTQEKNIGTCDYGTEEKRCNQIVDVTEEILKAHNIIVYRNKPTMTLAEVVKHSNNLKPDIHFAIHTNAYDKASRGLEVFCHKYSCTVGYKLAKEIYGVISPLTPTSDRGIKQGYNFYGTGKHIYELAYTSAGAALAEIIFHDNPDDAKWLIKNINLVGVNLAIGILNFFNVPYKAVRTKYQVIAGTYRALNNAITQSKKLEKAGFEAYIKEV
jgi:N-acetylmuramoyl-L-alanine amidase